MKVAIHPNRHLVNAGIEECISVTPHPRRKGTRTRYAGTVVLGDVDFVVYESGVKRAQAEGVRNVHAWAVGELLSESPGQVPLSKRRGMRKVTYHFQEGYFRDHDNHKRIYRTRALYAVGRDFYYLAEDWNYIA